MPSIVLDWIEINTYCASVGPGRGRPARPTACPLCDGGRVWFDGWRQVFAVVLVDGAVHRFSDGLWLQRGKCASCRHSWPLRPPWVYPHRSFEPDAVEGAALAYLADARATYRAVASRWCCSARSVWRWVGWCGTLANPPAVLAEAARLAPAAPSAEVIPREVPQVGRKARSQARAGTLLAALQLLVALLVLTRAQPHPPDDPSPLRWWLQDRFLRFRQVVKLTRPVPSPAMPQMVRGPPE